MEETTKVSENGKSQAARLMSKEEKQWETFLEGLYGFTDDFFQDGREQDAPPTQEGACMA